MRLLTSLILNGHIVEVHASSDDSEPLCPLNVELRNWSRTGTKRCDEELEIGDTRS